MDSRKTYRDAPGSDLKLPKEVYHRCLWIVRDCGRLERLASVLDGSGRSTWTEGAAEAADVVTDAAARHAAYELGCIERALEGVPEVYREGLLDNIIEKKPFGDFAHPNTWKRWKLVFLHGLAKQLDLI
jgi:hypothetical protein